MQFEKYTLPNGLEVILHRDARLPIVAVNLWYHVGPADESDGRTGFAHLFEHMMFQGSAHIPPEAHFRLLEGAGASLVNGTTDFDRTNYLEDLPSNQLELALWLESDRMGFLLERLDQAMLSNQQDVVRNERRQSVENAPYGLVEEEVWHHLFPPGHPYYASVIGSHEDIQAARLEDVHDFFRSFYAPNNASLSIAGDFEPAQARVLVEKYFGSLPCGPETVPPRRVETPPIREERRATVTDRVELPRLYMAWHSPRAFQPGDADAAVAARILGGGKASRLYERLVYAAKIAQSVNAMQQSLALASVFQIVATAKPGHSAEEMERMIDEEIDRFAAEGPTEAEMEAARCSIRASLLMSLENLGGFGGIADRLNRYNHYLGDPGYLERDLARFAATTAQGVRHAVAEHLRRDRRVVVHGIPGEKRLPPDPPTLPPPPEVEVEIAPREAWRTEMPRPVALRAPDLPEPKRFQLANGLEVYLLETRAAPVVTAYLVSRAGSAADPAGLPGVAGFTAAMLDEGTDTRDALGLARDLEAIGADLYTGAGHDGMYVWARSLAEQTPRSLELFADVALRPSFPEHEVERVRHDRITALLQWRDSPSQIASRVMYENLYGALHPYGHLALGTEETVPRIERADLVRYYAGRFAPGEAALIFAGTLDERDTREFAERWFGAWSGTAPQPVVPAPPPPQQRRVILVDKPEAPQTMLLLAQPSVRRADADFERLNVMNQVLGGLFSSRVNLNLRERHGYTYGAFSGIGEYRGVGPLWIGASVRADVSGASLHEMFAELEAMQRAPVTEDELTLAKDSLSRSLPSMFETTESIASTFGSLFLLGLPADYYRGLPARLEAMSREAVFETTCRHLAPERTLVVAVGDRATIEPQVEALGLGAIEYRDLTGQLLDI
jgi:zinc protease